MTARAPFPTHRAHEHTDRPRLPALPARRACRPPPPIHPSRHWVQIATGRDRAALRFDWRRFAREAPAVLGKLEPHVTRWGQANRLLAGPYDSPRAAREAIAALAKEGVDSFIFTSEAGQEIERLR
ncbi:SPOR domain-containing protein [Leptolyngbya sp. 15MV]|nr:SPOR domain-containing protein [Leptolyngbya sp. 15MV]